MKIEVGQIFRVFDNFEGKKTDILLDGRKATVAYVVEAGEYIEIRFPYEWHFRTTDNLFLHATPLEILKNCALVGRVKEDSFRRNKLGLQEIIDTGEIEYLFDELNEVEND